MRRALLLGFVAACSAHTTSPRELDPPPPPPPPTRVAGAPAAPPARLPDSVTPLAYDVRLELDPERDTFRGHVELRVQITERTNHLWLHAEGLEITGAQIRRADGSTDRITALDVPGAKAAGMIAFGFVERAFGETTFRFDYTGRVGTDDEGLFRQQADGAWFVFAQSQAMFARRILPCLDEPRWKPSWRVTLVVPKGHAALANGADEAERALPDGRREVRFAELAAMPTYLFAVAAGPFALVDAGILGDRGIPVRVAVAPRDARQVGLVRDRLPAIANALEGYLGRPLPLAKLDLVAVPRFFGGMENVGLVTLQRSLLVGDPKSPFAVQRFVRYVAHELAHQWFGNSVTPAWWDDLWLSEAFTSWLAEKVSDELGVTGDPEARAALTRLSALAADDAPGARPLRVEVGPRDDVDDRFDSIAYDKGAAVLRMLEQFEGEAAFAGRIRRYLTAFEGRAITMQHVLRSFAEPAGGAVAALPGYLTRTGSPVIELALDCAPTPKKLALAPRGDVTVPVCLRYPEGKRVVDTCRLVDRPGHVWLDTCPAWIVGNARGSGYYRTAAPLLARGAPLTTGEKLAYGDDVAAALLRGELPIAGALAELRALAGGDVAASQLAAVVIAEAIDPLVDDATRPAWTAWLAARFGKATDKGALLRARHAIGYELRDRLAALLGGAADAATLAAARTLVDRALADGDEPPAPALALAAPRGGSALFDRVLAAAAGNPALLPALGAFGPELAPRVVDAVLDPRWKPADAVPAVAVMLARPATRTAAWRAVVERGLVAKLDAADADALVEAAAALCHDGAAAEVTATFRTGDAALRGRTVTAIERCLARRRVLGNFAAVLP